MNVCLLSILLVTLVCTTQANLVSSDNSLDHILQNETWSQTIAQAQKLLLGGNTIHKIKPNYIDLKAFANGPNQQEGAVCSQCRFVATEVLRLRRQRVHWTLIANVLINMCTSLEVAPNHVCRGMVHNKIHIILFIIDGRRRLTANTICGLMFQSQNCILDDVYRSLEWSINVDTRNARPADASKRFGSNTQEREPLTIVHITDTHTDPFYVPGSLAECNEPLCCRANVLGTSNATREQLAGYWGDYRNCDSPWVATLNVFEQIKANHKKIDYIYFTGDIVDHADWETSTRHNGLMIELTFNALKEVFGDVPVLPVIGNHEPHPVNQFAPSYRTEWGLESNTLYNILAVNWAKWLPRDALATLRRSGYYTMLLRPGLRVIGLNNNDGSTYNWWLIYDAAYATRQLQWLHNTLLAAERAGEKVHILAHFPNGYEDLHRTYSREYQRIVERFWDTISGQFNGHTHHDQFHVFYDQATSTRAINVAWNGGSATAYTDVNPNYRVYTVEPETFQVTGHDTWIYNLTEANRNANRKPNWFHEYSFQDAYSMPDLSPASLDALLTRFSQDFGLMERYWQFKVKQGDPSLDAGCDQHCLAAELCALATTVSEPRVRNARCQELLRQWAITVARS